MSSMPRARVDESVEYRTSQGNEVQVGYVSEEHSVHPWMRGGALNIDEFDEDVFRKDVSDDSDQDDQEADCETPSQPGNLIPCWIERG